jgi:ATP synthase protein I
LASDVHKPDANTVPEPTDQDDLHRKSQEELAEIVGAKENRKVRARQEAYGSVWFGLGMFGIIGWSVVVPAIACIAIGVWIDTRWPSPYSWTLMLLFVGVVLGCLNAWYWVTRERNKLDL